jgi:hypothetical protein
MFFCLKTVGQLLDRTETNSVQIAKFLSPPSIEHPVLLASFYNLLEHYSGCLLDVSSIIACLLEKIVVGLSHPSAEVIFFERL